MAKAPVTENRFRIHIETSVEEMGPLMERLTLMGFTNVGHELITDVVTFNKRKVFETTAEEFALVWIEDHPEFRHKEMVQHFADHGRNPNTAGYAVQKLAVKGEITSLGGGLYRKAMKALPAPVAQSPAPDRKPSRELILEGIGKRKRFKSIELTELFRSHGRAGSEMTSALYRMLEAGLIKRLAPGDYEVIPGVRLPKIGLKQSKQAPEPPRKTRPPNPIARYDVSNKDLILRHIVGKDEFTMSELVELFRKNNRPEKSISPQMTVMAQAKLVKSLGDGRYQVLVKGKKASATSQEQKSVTESTNQEGF
jgi:hypothetical protein